ncbi:terminase small subunit [Pseudomonas sp. Irchel s3b5]|uniref:terminase small subunit n=1 Tax=Pseudomonas sp. Irchel s3b5 TaxID=2009077 RepID=UPI000BA36A79|nr:terminase small subunit [Pseudomonas sp. Irchel s3b5]
MTTLTKAEFATRQGWSKPYVSKLAKSGRLVLMADGMVDVEATDRLLFSTADPSKANVAARHERERIQRRPEGNAPAPQIVSHQAPLSVEGIPDFQESRDYREFYESRLTESEFHKNRGAHVELEAVKTAAYTSGRMLRDLLLGMPPQLAPELAAMSDHWQIEKHLTAALRRVLDDAERISSTDLIHSLTAAS